MSDHEHVLVAGVLQRPSRTVELLPFGGEWFEDPKVRALHALIVGYHRKRDGRNALDLALARTVVERAQGKKVRELGRLLDEYARFEPVTDPEFREALRGFVVDRRKALLRTAGASAADALVAGDYGRARQVMRDGLVAIDEADPDEDRPTDLRGPEAVAAARAELERPKVASPSFDVGMDWITRRVSLKRKELTIVGGYTSDGKTALTKSLVYNANQKGANVLFVALEMERAEMTALFVAQHAASLEPSGVPWREILDGSADDEDRALYRRALDDFEIRDSRDDEAAEVSSAAGSLHVWAPRQQITMTHLCDRVRALREDRGLDVVVIDFLELVEPGRDLGQYRLNVRDMCKRSKALAREEDVWVVANHQISRAGRDAAEKRTPNKHYLLRDLGESSGVEQAADHVLWIFSDEESRAEHVAWVGIAKARKGRTLVSGRQIMANFGRGVLGPLQELDE